MKVLVFPFVLLASLLLWSGFACAATELTIEDCGKCHELQPQEIRTAGAAHEAEINCLDCHTGHRPASPNNIPECGLCHQGSDHYALDNCVGCHNPHKPLNVVLEGELKAECLSCHVEQNAQLEANPSMHTEFACNFCHADRHGNIPTCLQCHAPHSEEMGAADCATCHQAHQPLVLEYPATTQNTLCASCHSTAYNQLLASQTKHRDIACVECHADKHKTVPQCSSCHGKPHAAGIHAKFPQCGSCHNTAHDLNNLGTGQ